MTTENKNEKKTTSIFDIYEQLGVSNVSKNQIIIDHSSQREKNAKMYYSLLVGLPFLIAILTYNTQGFITFMGTILFIVLAFIYSKYKYNIWHKKISFDNIKGTISYKRHFPKKNFVFKYDDIFVSSKTHCIKSNCSVHYYLSKKGYYTKEEKKHSLFTGYIYAADDDKVFFIKLLKQFMEQGTLSKDLKPYDKSSIENNVKHKKYNCY